MSCAGGVFMLTSVLRLSILRINDMSTLIIHAVIVFTLTIGVAIAVILLSDRLATLKNRLSTGGKETAKIKESPDGNIPREKTLKQIIFEAINKAAASEERSQEIAEAVSGIFAEELEKKAELTRQELSRQYGMLVEEKEQSEKAVWEKYNKVLVDKKETEAVIRSIAEGLVVVDAEGNVVMMNPTAEKLLGVSQKDKIGRHILEDPGEEQLISLVTKSPGGEDREIEVISREDETKKILRSSSAVIESEDGKTVGMVSVLSDVTKQKELDQLKSDFVSKITHELRTPIMTLQNSVALLLGRSLGAITEKQEEFLNIAKRSLDRLALLIDSLLDMAKLEASNVQLKLEPCSIEKLINDTCETLSAWAATKVVRIEKNIQKNIPETLLDYNRIIQVLTNIIGNAVKFTPREGVITIEAGLDKDKKNVLVSVSDTGAGISGKDLEKIFEKFQQGGERPLTDISGTGLGLAIAKEIILLHKGRIWAQSEKGRGASFSFLLPITAV